MGPGSCLCPARAALPVPLGPPLAQIACPSPVPEPRGAGAPGGARSRWRPSPRVCKFRGDLKAGLGCGVSGNGAPLGIWITRDLPWDGSRGAAGLGPRGLKPLDPCCIPPSSPYRQDAPGTASWDLLPRALWLARTPDWHFVKSAGVEASRKLNRGS